MDAQKARGLELEKGNFLKRIRNYIPILIPLIVSAIRRSLELAEAMESRAWGATKNRTNLYVLKMHKGDLILITLTIGLLAASVYTRLYVGIPSVYDLLRNTFHSTSLSVLIST
jgi:energy-coupling factor transport system permease protein